MGWFDPPSGPPAGAVAAVGRATGAVGNAAAGCCGIGAGIPTDGVKPFSLSRGPRAAGARTIAASTSTSLGPPIISRCSTLSRRMSTSCRWRSRVEGVHHAEPGLAGTPARHVEAATKDEAEQRDADREDNRDGGQHQPDGQQPVVREKITKRLHQASNSTAWFDPTRAIPTL